MKNPFPQIRILMRDCLLFRRLLLPESTVHTGDQTNSLSPNIYLHSDNFFDTCKGAGRDRGWEGGGSWPFLFFGKSLNPIQSRRADYTHHITTGPPDFWNFHHLSVTMNSWSYPVRIIHTCINTYVLLSLIYFWSKRDYISIDKNKLGSSIL